MALSTFKAMPSPVSASDSSECYSVSAAKNEVKDGIRAYLSKDEKGNYIVDVINRCPFYLEGPPGIGKTYMVNQIADELGIGFVSFSVTHHIRNSVLGLPVIKDLENGKKYTEYTMSEIIAAVEREREKGAEEGILLLDEFNCASDTIMPVMLAFLQTRNIGLYTLPENWIIVLCGNPTEYNSSAKRFTPAILDRVRKISIATDVDSFFEYAENKGFNPHVLNFLKLNPDNLYKVTCSKTDSETVTARGWENLSVTMNSYEKAGIKLTAGTVRQFIKSRAIASEFWKYYWLNINSFSEDEMLQIINGNYTDELVETFNKRDKVFLGSALEVIEKGILRTAVYDSPKVSSGYITNTFEFLKKLKDSESVREKFFYFITQNETLLSSVRKTANHEYLEIAKKMYAVAV